MELSAVLTEGVRTALRRRGTRDIVACVLARLGDVEGALDLLEQVADAGFGHRNWIEHDTDLAPLRDHPRFAALLEKMR